MLLSTVVIKNFRSIKDLTIKFYPKCRILVGINESGKSNILKALSMLSNDEVPSKEDIREVLPDELPVKEAFIHFIFFLEESEINQIYKNVKAKFLATNINVPILKKGKQNITLELFCHSKREGLYRVNILTAEKKLSYWSIRDEYETLQNWKKPSSKCPATFMVQIADGTSMPFKNYFLVNNKDYPDIPQEYLSDITTGDVNHAVGNEITELIKEELPEAIYWTYSEHNLLPGQINLAQFAANPESCIPLKHMFELADITDIQKSVEEAKLMSVHSLRNLLKRVADRVTKHLHNVWKDYKSIKIQLIPNGENIDASVQDEFNYYEFSRRSDGFKRFVTFLLMVSVKVKTGLLRNTLLLIDEPDISLHPSGARYFRDELIKISEKNYVFYSTHSIFMIDRENIKRHFIVKKNNEITSVTEVNKSNVIDEEVIYNALGYSIFESLKKKNIIFEGWRDKKLFQVAIQRLPAPYKALKKVFDEVGLCHAKGAKDIQTITPLLELANRKCLILSDDDNPSKEKQKKYVKNKGYGVWKRYSELLPDVKAVTGEDFIKSEVFRKPIATLRKRYSSLPELSDADLSDARGKIYTLQNWFKKGGFNKEDQKEIIDSIKESIFTDLKPAHIEPIYYELLSKLVKLL